MDNSKRNGICAPEGRVFIPHEQALGFALGRVGFSQTEDPETLWCYSKTTNSGLVVSVAQFRDACNGKLTRVTVYQGETMFRFGSFVPNDGDLCAAFLNQSYQPEGFEFYDWLEVRRTLVGLVDASHRYMFCLAPTDDEAAVLAAGGFVARPHLDGIEYTSPESHVTFVQSSKRDCWYCADSAGYRYLKEPGTLRECIALALRKIDTDPRVQPKRRENTMVTLGKMLIAPNAMVVA